jgi:hypothetical protein
MRITIALLAIVAITAALIVACRPHDAESNDSTQADSTAARDARAPDTVSGAVDTVPPTAATPSSRASARSGAPGDTSHPTDTIPSQDSLRAMRPRLPQVTPERPREWRGLKLPEERRARTPVLPITKIERAPDSVTAQDTTKKPPR